MYLTVFDTVDGVTAQFPPSHLHKLQTKFVILTFGGLLLILFCIIFGHALGTNITHKYWVLEKAVGVQMFLIY